MSTHSNTSMFLCKCDMILVVRESRGTLSHLRNPQALYYYYHFFQKYKYNTYKFINTVAIYEATSRRNRNEFANICMQ